MDTPAGRLGILIGSDSWYPENYRTLNEKGAQLIAVPAFIIGKTTWDQPWGGYKSVSTPSEISLKPGEVTEGDAWHRLTLISSAPISTAEAGITVFCAASSGTSSAAAMALSAATARPAPTSRALAPGC